MRTPHETHALAARSSFPEEPSFHELLFEWLERAPWLAISAAAHVVLLLVLTLLPWELFEEAEPNEFQARFEREEEPAFEEPPPEEPEPIDPEDLPEEPEIEEPTLSEPVEDPSPTPSEDEALFPSDSPQDDPSPFENLVGDAVIGIGGPAGGAFGDRPSDGGGGPGGGAPREEIDRALQWLVRHQRPDGGWDADGFAERAACDCAGPGHAEHDVGVTGLALLALLGDGHTTLRGRYKENVARGVRWLLDRQDPDSGLVGERIGHAFLYDHGIATLTLCEAYYFSKSPLMKSKVQSAVGYVTRARNPYGVWRYDVPPNGDDDTSVTGWMVLALKSAQEAGLTIDSAAFSDTLSWLDEVTDPTTGRCGYDSVGSPGSRIDGVNDHYPTDGTEAMTSVALLCRAFLGQTPEDTPAMARGAELLREALPEHHPEGLTNDFYYWYYGSYAMYQLGGRDWRAWSRALDGALVRTQRRDGHASGSWDPDGPWGSIGGRVYATALGALCLEAYYRYSRVLGGR